MSGRDITAKDFRTWAGTVLAAMALAEFETFDTAMTAKANVREAIERVSRRLGNTPTICRKCYVHPEVLTSYLDGALLLEIDVAPPLSFAAIVANSSLRKSWCWLFSSDGCVAAAAAGPRGSTSIGKHWVPLPNDLATAFMKCLGSGTLNGWRVVTAEEGTPRECRSCLC